MSNTVIKVENLSKYYRLGLIGGGTLREDVNQAIAKLRGRPDPLLKIGEKDHGNRKDGQIWALRDVNFEVQQGEILGIIGGNGAGKSTLLKILSRITAPTDGSVKIKGRVGSLLEVGTGFHPELTGRENIYLNGTILGMNREEVSTKLDEIVEFAEMGKFIDTPVKRYSSGMTVRLAFAVAAHLEPEILIVDEVLAVGDAAFQAKCLGKMKDVAGGGRTVLFVSHNMGSVLQLCSRGILIEKGHVAFDGDIDAAVRRYVAASDAMAVDIASHGFRGHENTSIRFNRVCLNFDELKTKQVIDPHEDIVIQIFGTCDSENSDFEIFTCLSMNGVRIASLFDSPPKTKLCEGKFVSEFRIPKKTLRPGLYTLGFGGQRAGGYQWFIKDHAAELEITERWDDQLQRREIGVLNFEYEKRRYYQ